MAASPLMKDTTKPTKMKSRSPWDRACQDFSRSYPVAANMVGMARKKENSVAACRDRPKSSPPKAITPKLDVKAGSTGWHQELAYFVNCVAKGVKPDKYQTLDSVADTMKLVFAEEKSVKNRKPITLK